MKLLFLALVAATLAVGYYYYFVDTLTLSEIAESSEDSAAGLLANLMDFDTGLSRYDVYRLSRKADTWEERWRKTDSISDPDERRAERRLLLSEMSTDPAFRKLSDRLSLMGDQAAQSLMDLLAAR